MGKNYFIIKSDMNGKVLDVQGSDDGAGAKVIMWDQNDPPTDNQLWFINNNGYIKSKLNNFALDCSDGAICLRPMDDGDRLNKVWIFKGNKIVNEADDSLCVDIRGSDDDNGAEIVAYEYNGQDNQHWRCEPV